MLNIARILSLLGILLIPILIIIGIALTVLLIWAIVATVFLFVKKKKNVSSEDDIPAPINQDSVDN